jgi:prophage regulatory protein
MKDEMVMNKKTSGQLLRLPEVLDRLPIGKTTFYKGIGLGLFPEPVRLGKRTVAWVEEQLDEAIRDLPRSQAFQQLLADARART